MYPPSHSFRPQINPKSNELSAKRENAGSERWRALYELDNQKKMKLEEKRREIEEERLCEEEENATFQPNVNRTTGKHRK